MKSIKVFILLTVCSIFLGMMLTSCTKPVKSFSTTDFAMGSAVNVKLYGYNEKQLAKPKPMSVISALENDISKNIPGSFVSRLNKDNAADFSSAPNIYEYIKETAQIYSQSGGKAAVTSGALTELWGFDDDNFNLPQDNQIKSAINFCGDNKIIFNDEKQSISIEKGYIVNLGSVGKGIACDAAVDYFNDTSDILTGGVVSVGGSVATWGSPPTGDKWSVGIRNPFGSENEYFAILSLDEAFISTSGDYEKKFTADNGETYSHILDLTTGYPAKSDLASVTIIAKTGLQSDALSTMCFILGKDNSLDILRKYGAEAIFVYKDKTVFATDGIKDSIKITASGFTLV